MDSFNKYLSKATKISCLMQGIVFIYVFLESNSIFLMLFLAMVACGVLGIFCKVKPMYIAYALGCLTMGIFNLLDFIDDHTAVVALLVAIFELFVSLLVLRFYFINETNKK